MKIRPSIALLTAAVLFLSAFLIWRAREKPIAITAPAEAEANPDARSIERSRVEPITPAARPAQPSSPAPNAPATAKTSEQSRETKEEQTVKILSKYNDMPIVYYGKLEDQFGNPVPNAAIHFSIRVINGYDSTTDRGQVTSDAAGLV